MFLLVLEYAQSDNLPVWTSLAGLRTRFAADRDGIKGANVAWEVEGARSILDIEQAYARWMIVLDEPSLVDLCSW